MIAKFEATELSYVTTGRKKKPISGETREVVALIVVQITMDRKYSTLRAIAR